MAGSTVIFTAELAFRETGPGNEKLSVGAVAAAELAFRKTGLRNGRERVAESARGKLG